jgi:hypothetical protein
MSGRKQHSNRIYYKEVQHLSKSISWGITLLLLFLLAALFKYTQIRYFEETSILGYTKEFKMLIIGDIIITIIVVGIIFILLNLKMIVKITHSSLYFKKPPLSTTYKKIYKDRIDKVKVIKLSDLPKGTITIKIKGDDGVVMALEDKRLVFIGSQHPEALKGAVEKLISNRLVNKLKAKKQYSQA